LNSEILMRQDIAGKLVSFYRDDVPEGERAINL